MVAHELLDLLGKIAALHAPSVRVAPSFFKPGGERLPVSAPCELVVVGCGLQRRSACRRPRWTWASMIKKMTGGAVEARGESRTQGAQGPWRIERLEGHGCERRGAGAAAGPGWGGDVRAPVPLPWSELYPFFIWETLCG